MSELSPVRAIRHLVLGATRGRVDADSDGTLTAREVVDDRAGQLDAVHRRQHLGFGSGGGVGRGPRRGTGEGS